MVTVKAEQGLAAPVIPSARRADAKHSAKHRSSRNPRPPSSTTSNGEDRAVIPAKYREDWDESDRSNYEALLKRKHQELVLAVAQRRVREQVQALARHPPPSLRLEASPGAPPLSAVIPAVYDHYSQNSPDFSGAQMYKVEQDFVGPFKTLVRMAPENISIAILVGETQPQPWRKSFWLPQTLILELKASVYQTLNHKLVNADKFLSPVLLMTVLALARYEAFINESWEPARAHLRGIKEMMRSRPDLDLLPHPFLHFALLWCDRACAMFSGQPPIFDRPSNAACNPASPLVTALAPKPVDVSLSQWRRIMTSFYRTPGAQLINVFAKLTKLIPALKLTATRKQTLHSLREEQLDLLRRTPDAYTDLLTFSDPRFDMQARTFEALRRTALLLISAAVHRQTQTVTSQTDLDHNTMSLFLLDLAAIVTHSPASALFILCLGGPFATGPIFDGAARALADAAVRLGLLGSSWSQVQRFLAYSLFYYPDIQDDTCPLFWDSSALHTVNASVAYRFGSD